MVAKRRWVSIRFATIRRCEIRKGEGRSRWPSPVRWRPLLRLASGWLWRRWRGSLRRGDAGDFGARPRHESRRRRLIPRGFAATAAPLAYATANGYCVYRMSTDTTEDARDAQITALRRLGPSGRFLLAAEMSEDVRRISIEGERRRHPDLTESAARLAVFRRLWGVELAVRALSRSAGER